MSDWKCVREAGGICEWHRFDGYMFRIFDDFKCRMEFLLITLHVFN